LKEINMLTRRTLLAGAALGLAGTQLARAAADRDGAARMQLAVDSTMFTKYKTPEVWTRIRAAGYRRVEIGIEHFRSHEIDEPSVDRLEKEIRAAGLELVAAFIVHPFSHPDEAARRKAVDRWRRSIAATARLGVKLITTELTGDLAQPAKSEASFRKSMDELLPVFQQARIRLSVEPHPGDFFEAGLPTIKLLAGFRSPHLGYLHCLPHTFFLGDTRAVITAAGPLLTHVHVADTFPRKRLIARAGVGLHMHLRPPLGEVNFPEAFDALHAIGYHGAASVQLLSHLDDPSGTAVQTRSYLQQTFGQLIDCS
jgi:myo-inositol catabolism protein IolH